MPLRFIMALLVFAGSFALGLGGTYLLISRSGVESVRAVPRTVAQAPESEVRGSEVVVADEVEPVDVGTIRPEKGLEPHLDTLSPPSTEPGTAEGQAKEPEPTPPDANPLAWWQGLEGRKCRVALDEVGFSALSIRDGSFETNEKVNWEKRFSRSRKVTSLRARKHPVVLVKAIGFDAQGVPSAAVVETDGAHPKRGVIALQVEGKSIRLVPEEEVPE